MEIIGLLLAITVAMGIAVLAGAVCVGFVLLTTKRQAIGRTRTAILAGLFPPAIVIYLFAFAVFLGVLSPSLGGGDILFGDGDEPLPNSYAIHYLGKMPTAAWIEHRPPGRYGVGSVAALQVIGSRIAGRYDHTYQSQLPANFFLFDTETGITLDFQSESELSQSAHVPINLTETQFFHGHRSAAYKVFSALWLILATGPPMALAVWLVLYWNRVRKGSAQSA